VSTLLVRAESRTPHPFFEQAAEPGPICFGRGTQPTVDEATFLGGGIHLDRERAMRMLRAQKGSSATV
jgi:N-methylhydantoinase A